MALKVAKNTTPILGITKLVNKLKRESPVKRVTYLVSRISYLIGERRFTSDASKATLHAQSGLSLIEILIVVAIIGLIMGISVGYMGDWTDSKLSETSSKLAGTIKYVYNEAAVKNQYYRLLIDLNAQTFSVEASSDPFKIGRGEEGMESTGEGEGIASPKSEATPEPEGAEPPKAAGGFSATGSYLLKPIKLPEGIRIKDVFVAHAQNKIENGRTAIYFFPNGWVEKAVINLSDDKGEAFYSLETNPSTGKTKIRTEYFELKQEEEKK